MTGCVVSRPGAEAQQFHNDGDSGLVNIFIPLVSIEEDGDGTQLWPGTHAFGSDMSWKAPDERAMRHMRSPAIDAGGLMLFDYVLIHRGLANPIVGGRERPVAYVVVALDGLADDTNNFPDTSVCDAIVGAPGTWW